MFPDKVIKYGYFVFNSILYTMIYCFSWFVFDKRGIEGYAFSVITFVCCILYIFSPVQLVPDFIPVIGGIDDYIVIIVSLFVGIRGFENYKNKNDANKDIVEHIINGNNIDAIKSYLKSNGYKFK